VAVQIVRRITRRRDWKLKSAVYLYISWMFESAEDYQGYLPCWREYARLEFIADSIDAVRGVDKLEIWCRCL
jgi:hypothetical protein